MFDFTNNYRIARRVAGEGIVLLKNENNVLPLKKDDSLAVIGDNCLYSKTFCDRLDSR